MLLLWPSRFEINLLGFEPWTTGIRDYHHHHSTINDTSKAVGFGTVLAHCNCGNIQCYCVQDVPYKLSKTLPTSEALKYRDFAVFHFTTLPTFSVISEVIYKWFLKVRFCLITLHYMGSHFVSRVSLHRECYWYSLVSY